MILPCPPPFNYHLSPTVKRMNQKFEIDKGVKEYYVQTAFPRIKLSFLPVVCPTGHADEFWRTDGA